MNFWIEKTIIKGRADRIEGERALGKRLWSPQKDKRGADIYKNMRMVSVGDIILHLIDNEMFSGISVVLKAAVEAEGVMGTEWEGPAYCIELDNYIKLEPPLERSAILSEKNKNVLLDINKKSEVFYNEDLNLRQGAYLTPCTIELLQLINNTYKSITSKDLPLIKEKYFTGINMMVSEKNFINEFSKSIAATGLQFDEEVLTRFCSSLLTKPFVILTGLSGSGKTKLAHTFAIWICDNDESKVSEDLIELTLPINKSAIEHNGWTLPKNYTRKGNNEVKDVKIIIDGEIIDAHIDSLHRLFYDKKIDFSNKYKIGDEINVKMQLKTSNANSNQFRVIPVGADWTSREPLLGYPNALVSGKYVKPDNGIVDLLIEASQPENENKPYFLILDEMNLSHVERYFADFLSVMETHGAIPLHSDTGEWTDENDNPVPCEVSLPPNLFIIGTVNIDETTYMFSPKVLDRANVIEFRITEKEIDEFLKNPVKPEFDSIKGAGAGMAADFVKIAKEKIVNFNDQEVIKESLIEFFKELKKTGSEFGYRTSSEIFRFTGILRNLTESEGKPWSTDDIIDAAILQKLLPKLHGSKKKLEKVLESLGKLCLKKDLGNSDETWKKLIAEPDLIDDSDDVRFKRSLEKILRMKRRADQDGFTSFAEA